MTVVNPKSISGITSITTASGSDNLLTIHTSDANNTERLRIDSTGTTKIVTGIVTTLTATTGIVTTLTASTITSLGDVDIADKIVHTGDTNTAIRFPAADTVSVETGGAERLNISSSTTIFNDAGADIDFRIESDTKGSMFFLDAGNNRIGINNGSPTCMLDITGADTSGDGIVELLKISGTGNNNNDGVKLTFARVGSESCSITAKKILDNNTTDLIFNTRSGNTVAEKFRMKGDGDLSISDGNLVIGTSGHGIDFSATANTSATGASMSSELLDDYEEGTFTPILRTSGDATEPSYTRRQGKYTKIGRVVTWIARIDCSSTLSSHSGVLQMYGLPFNAMTWGGNYDWPGFCSLSYYNNLLNVGSSTNPRFLGPSSGADYVRLHTFSNSDDTSNNAGNVIKNGTLFILGGSYQAT